MNKSEAIILDKTIQIYGFEHPVTIEVAEVLEADMNYYDKLRKITEIYDTYPLMDIEEE